MIDLTRADGVVRYRFNDAEWLLRAPLGMYLSPVAIGKVAGVGAA